MINQGMYVTHLHRKEWGIGKVLDGHSGTTLRLWFESGGEKKIGADYHGMLQRVAPPASFQVPSVMSAPPKTLAAGKFDREYFNGRWDFAGTSSEQKRFKSGELMRQWAEQYPFLFGPEDVEAAASYAGKGSGAFFEWAAAVRLYEARGYHSMLKDYASGLSDRKQQVVASLCNEAAMAFMEESSKKNPFPDLLVFTPDQSEWFFCEVKSPSDTVRKTEDRFFPILTEKTGAGIFLVGFTVR